MSAAAPVVPAEEAVAAAVDVAEAVVEDAVVELIEDEMVEVPLIGVGFRHPIQEWIFSQPDPLDCLELTAEHFFDAPDDPIRQIGELYPVSVHGLGLSLGTPGPIDKETLDQFERVARLADARWISEHIAFTKTQDVDLGHLNPVPTSRASLNTFVDHAREVMDVCGRPLLLENITSFLRIPGEIDETEFINELCRRSGAGLLLDVTNLLINSRNHEFDAMDWVRKIDTQHIKQLHIVGYSIRNGVWHDYHCEAVQPDLLELAGAVVSMAPVESIILERDGKFPPPTELEHELNRLEQACEAARCRS